MRILLLGANGQVGWELQCSLSPLGTLLIYDRQSADFENLTSLKKLLKQEKPDIIVNAAAYTAVDQAETDQDRAYIINSKAVAILAESAIVNNACLIHFSTDYVFDGNKQGSYSENDLTNPQSVYGKSKLEGEQAIISSGCKHFILRTSWVYASRGNNFAKTMLKLATERDELKVVADQIGAPTSAELIADVSAGLVSRLKNDSGFAENNSGIYNLVASGNTSWHGFASHVVVNSEKLGMKFKVQSQNIIPIKTEQFPRPAKRPHNSKLNTQKIESLLNISMPKWQFHVDRMVKEFIENQS